MSYQPVAVDKFQYPAADMVCWVVACPTVEVE